MRPHLDSFVRDERMAPPVVDGAFVVDGRVGPGVADQHPLKVDLGVCTFLVAAVDLERQIGHVVTAVRLTANPEGRICVLGEPAAGGKMLATLMSHRATGVANCRGSVWNLCES